MSNSHNSVYDYEVITVDNQGKVRDRQKRQAEYRTEDFGQGVNLELVMIPGGRFPMGSPKGEGNDSERPQHLVTVAPFWLSRHPITQAQWKAVAAFPQIKRALNSTPARFQRDNQPVEQVTWYDSVEFCDRLSQKTGLEYRLPSEAEWEYACRADTTTPFHFGPTLTTDLANYNNHYKGPTEVGKFGVANAFGLCDMHGNVWEWCLDHWHENYQNAPIDGRAWVAGGDDRYRIRRGGSWAMNPENSRSASRFRNSPDFRFLNLGLRVVCVL
ncbi:MAG: formylglycine-generating enzyme family protein [Leptolyngbyaceae cyanobacterium MO_188.B28]|nr:formylglycine-generating enzyme family protein [Leptolyngbyaceae cyanobacterium MO_188.B28]